LVGNVIAIGEQISLHWQVLVSIIWLIYLHVPVACMHILRSTYLPAYDSLIRAPYTSDPFSSPANPTSSGSVRREIATLDLFIALLAHEDVLLDATSLHLPREEAYKDLFDMVQPRSRLEDLILEEGLRTGLVYVGNAPSESSATEPVVAAPIAMDLPAVVSVKTENIPPQPSPSPTKTSFNPFSRSSYISLAKSKMRRTNTPPGTPSPTSPVDTSTASSSPKLKSRLNPLPFESIGVSFSPRSVALIYMPAVSSNGAYHGSTFGALSVSITGPTAAGGFKAKKTLVEVVRARDEQLEVSAKRLIQGLEEVMSAGGV